MLIAESKAFTKREYKTVKDIREESELEGRLLAKKMNSKHNLDMSDFNNVVYTKSLQSGMVVTIYKHDSLMLYVLDFAFMHTHAKTIISPEDGLRVKDNVLQIGVSAIATTATIMTSIPFWLIVGSTLIANSSIDSHSDKTKKRTSKLSKIEVLSSIKLKFRSKEAKEFVKEYTTPNELTSIKYDLAVQVYNDYQELLKNDDSFLAEFAASLSGDDLSETLDINSSETSTSL